MSITCNRSTAKIVDLQYSSSTNVKLASCHNTAYSNEHLNQSSAFFTKQGISKINFC